MAVEKQTFSEKISPFLVGKLASIEKEFGKDSDQYLGLARQYLFDDRETVDATEENLRHYMADINVQGESGVVTHGLERLYKRSLVVEPTFACAARCRYCLRRNYTPQTLTEKELEDVAVYCGAPENRCNLREVLITGGDPLIVPKRLNYLIECFLQHAPNINIIRIGTRLPFHDPGRIDQNVYSIFEGKAGLRFELAIQVNHPVEFFAESRDKIQELVDRGVRIYAQNVLLKGVNDDIDTLVELYDLLRDLNIEAHYLFHCIPMLNSSHFRTSINRGLELAGQLTSCGKISGRAKPMFAVMTDIGKIVLYQGAVIDRDESTNRVLLQSHYKLEDRMKWNPDWSVPDGVEVDRNGCLRVWYLDGRDS